MTHEEMREALEASPLFRNSRISMEEMRERRCRKGQILTDRKKDEGILGLIAGGKVDVYSIAMDGREVLLSCLKKGDCFGIINLFTDTELPTVLKCREDTTLLTIPKSLMVRRMKQDPEIALRYTRLCNQKMQFLIQKIELLTMQSARRKLLQYLLIQEEKADSLPAEDSRETLAALLGISRATLFRELSRLQEEGLIRLEGGRILIADRRKLETVIYECR